MLCIYRSSDTICYKNATLRLKSYKIIQEIDTASVHDKKGNTILVGKLADRRA